MHDQDKEKLPAGVKLTNLSSYEDPRGKLTEMFRSKWVDNLLPVQWNFVQSNGNTIRGMHVHRNHYDYLFVPNGKMQLGLKDLRRNSPTYLMPALITLDSSKFRTCLIPPGVAHCFYFPVPSILIYSLTNYWSLEDDLGCKWNDPEIGIDWPDINPELSERDTNAPGLSELLKRLENVEFQI